LSYTRKCQEPWQNSRSPSYSLGRQADDRTSLFPSCEATIPYLRGHRTGLLQHQGSWCKYNQPLTWYADCHRRRGSDVFTTASLRWLLRSFAAEVSH